MTASPRVSRWEGVFGLVPSRTVPWLGNVDRQTGTPHTEGSSSAPRARVQAAKRAPSSKKIPGERPVEGAYTSVSAIFQCTSLSSIIPPSCLSALHDWLSGPVNLILVASQISTLILRSQSGISKTHSCRYLRRVSVRRSFR